MIVWFTGQPASGKTTLAKELVNGRRSLKLTKLTIELGKFVHVDGDELRELFNNKDYSKEGRKNNMEGAINLCRFLEFKGFVPVVSIVAPYKEVREIIKKSADDFYEIYVHTDEIRGREHYFVDGYEPPTEEFLDIDTGKHTIEESVDMVWEYII
jgi:adenylylsulfate kinase-like enzyme